VRYDAAGTTIAHLASALDAPAVTVTAPGLGTLNHTALTLEALAARDISSLGVVIGSWPRDPGLAERNNLTDLEAIADGPLAGVLPAGAGQLARGAFASVAREGLTSRLGGLRAA
jgi:dethiobiotin synthetase